MNRPRRLFPRPDPGRRDYASPRVEDHWRRSCARHRARYITHRDSDRLTRAHDLTEGRATAWIPERVTDGSKLVWETVEIGRFDHGGLPSGKYTAGPFRPYASLTSIGEVLRVSYHGPVDSTRRICEDASSALSRIASSDKVLSGWVMTTGLSCWAPSAAVWTSASWTKAVVMMTAVGMPRVSNPTASCRLHDVQDPQSPIAVITTSVSAAIWSSITSGATREKLAFV